MRAGELQTARSFSLHGAGVQAARRHPGRRMKRRELPRLWRLARRLLSGNGMDALYIGIAAAFFAASWAFVVACDRLS